MSEVLSTGRPWDLARHRLGRRIEPNEKLHGETAMLLIGNPTPDLEVHALTLDDRFERLRLGALVGRWSVLFFYRKDFTFVCPTEIHGYEAPAPRFPEG
ncbi:MAG: redoxin domain-containing protein [Pseudomonadota bacterium]|nr:redoxin domain-containing protein [Pseudomonadota bacterium]